LGRRFELLHGKLQVLFQNGRFERGLFSYSQLGSFRKCERRGSFVCCDGRLFFLCERLRDGQNAGRR
jgi:hypothetical protein